MGKRVTVLRIISRLEVMKLEELARLGEQYTRSEGTEAPGASHHAEPVDGLWVFRRNTPTSFEALIYDPVICLILQGSKKTTIGDHQFSANAGDCVVVSHALPVMARIAKASPEHPYLALIVRLDLSELHNLDSEVAACSYPVAPSAYMVAPVDQYVLDVLSRYISLADDSTSAQVLTPLVRRELHFRLLTTHHGAALRTLLRRDSHASHIARAIHRLRADFREPLEVETLARFVSMSASSFYKHFKQVTGTTPLQFHKDLRLTEARRLLFAGEHSVSTAAFEVGYESATQFSREYHRKYGVPPRQHLRASQMVSMAGS